MRTGPGNLRLVVMMMLTACRLLFLLSLGLAKKAEQDERTFNLNTLGGLIGTGVGAASGAPLGAATGAATGGLAGAALSNALLNNPYIGGLLGGGTGAVVGGAAGAATGAGRERQSLSGVCKHGLSIFSCWKPGRQWYTRIGDRGRQGG